MNGSQGVGGARGGFRTLNTVTMPFDVFDDRQSGQSTSGGTTQPREVAVCRGDTIENQKISRTPTGDRATSSGSCNTNMDEIEYGEYDDQGNGIVTATVQHRNFFGTAENDDDDDDDRFYQEEGGEESATDTEENDDDGGQNVEGGEVEVVIVKTGSNDAEPCAKVIRMRRIN